MHVCIRMCSSNTLNNNLKNAVTSSSTFKNKISNNRVFCDLNIFLGNSRVRTLFSQYTLQYLSTKTKTHLFVLGWPAVIKVYPKRR